MSHDVLAKLNGLRDEVRARIEATTDYRALMTVEKAIGEMNTLLPPVVVAAAEAPAEAMVAAEGPAEVAAGVAVPEPAVEPAAAAAEPAGDVAVESSEAPVPDVEVKILEIPADDLALVAELASATSEGMVPANGTVTQ